MADDESIAKWIEAGLDELARGGIERVRVEVLAQNLGVTKGGFYRRFKDRPALLEAMLETWSRGRIGVIERQTELAGETPAERLKALILLFAERRNAQGMAIELGIRQWAQGDPVAAGAVAKVDIARVGAVARLYERMGFAAPDAEARAALFYAFIFGQGLIFLNASPERRAVLIETCADVLTRVSPDQ